MKDLFTQFREQSAMIKITPQRGTWERIKGKLEVHQSHRKMVYARTLGMAAVVLSIIAVSAVFLIYAQHSPAAKKVAFTVSFNDLSAYQDHAESIYDIRNIRKSHADLLH